MLGLRFFANFFGTFFSSHTEDDGNIDLPTLVGLACACSKKKEAIKDARGAQKNENDLIEGAAQLN